ncbi:MULTISPECIES: hypothetical protein [unclassified Pseudovibrio]|nr:MULTISPECIES: hypothetical protein [unclassified Pseudovibrio]
MRKPRLIRAWLYRDLMAERASGYLNKEGDPQDCEPPYFLPSL